MEKKKLLLVAVSIGVVMLIIIGIPLFILSPRQSRGDYVQSPIPAPEHYTVIEPPAPVPPPENDRIELPLPEAAETPRVTTITIPVPQTAAVPNVPPAIKPSAAKPVQQQRQPAAEAPKAAVKPPVSKPPASKPAAEAGKAYNNFWVQTGAFSTKIRAEGAKETLEAKGISSIIDNSDVDGKTWYRVRVGPYLSENEANYWLALVKSIDGFNDSQVRQTRAAR